MPVAEILAGIALVKASVDFIKSNIDTCKDIGEIGGAIDGLLRGQQDVNKKQGKRGLGVREEHLVSLELILGVLERRLAVGELLRLLGLRHRPLRPRRVYLYRGLHR